MDQEKIGKLIKKIRKQNNLTQKEFADKLGVTYQAVSKWENGKNMPDVALLKKISKDFNIDINDILNGEYNHNKKGKIRKILLPILFIIIIVLFILFHRDDSFSFKTISSQCSDFNITGSIAYNKKKSSIYISDIDYCGKNGDLEYTKIECILYESENGKDKKIEKYIYDGKPIKLDKYLKNLNIKIDDYTRTCRKYTKGSLYLKIKAKAVDDKLKIYKVPLSLSDNC